MWLNVDQSLNMDLFYEDGLHLIKEGNELLSKEIMIFHKELSSTVYNPPRISYKNMASFCYNNDVVPPLSSSKTSRQSTPVYIPVKPYKLNSKVVSFSNTINSLLFEKKMFACTVKAYMFPL